MTTIEKARQLRECMKERRVEVKATLKELQLLLSCQEKGDYTPMFSTKLYSQHGGEYCEYLSLLYD